MAKRSPKEPHSRGVTHLLEPMLKRQSDWLVSRGFPDDISRAVKIAAAELGELVTSKDVDDFPMDNVWELLNTCVDRRQWLAKIDRPADNSAMLVQPATPPTLPFRLHLCDVPQTLKRDGFKEVITLQNEDYWKLMQSLMAAYPNAVPKSKLNQLFRFPNDRKNHPKKLREIIDKIGLTVENWVLKEWNP